MVAGYRTLLASYVGERDGMALELARDDGEQVAEVFEDDATKARTFKMYTDSPVPIEAIEWLLSSAKDRL